MKHHFPLAALAAALLTLVPASLRAQDLDYSTTYAPAWIRLIAFEGNTEPASRVSAQQLDGKGTPIYRATYDFKAKIPIMSESIAIFTALAKPADGYELAGWYIDDGDGVFDIEKDELLDVGEELSTTLTIDAAYFGDTFYATQAETPDPKALTAPNVVLFAFFSRGAKADINYHQDSHGAVIIDKFPNNPGDVVTIEAFPEDGYEFLYWKDTWFPRDPAEKDVHINVVSTENPYTFTVQGGERFYAVFRRLDAIDIQFPEEGGFRAIDPGVPGTWTFDERDEVVVYVFEKEDVIRDAAGRCLFNTANIETNFDDTQGPGKATLIYGKGTAHMLYREEWGYSRGNPIVSWSGTTGATVNDASGIYIHYVYVFSEEAGAFVQYAHSDTYWHPETAQETINIPAGMAYVSMEAEDLTDDNGNIPLAIGMTPEGYDYAVAHHDELVNGIKTRIDAINANGTPAPAGARTPARTFTIGGAAVSTPAHKGIYVTGGKKVVIR